VKKFFVVPLLWLSVMHFMTKALAQPTRTSNPYIINFDKTIYGGGTENWDIHASSDGYVYAANNEGLLTFNGKNWNKYTLPNNTIMRSIAVDTLHGRVFAGGQDEIGFFSRDQKGHLNYTSLKTKMPSGYNSFEDVWDMQIMNGSVFFRTMQQIFRYDGKNIYRINTPDLQISLLRCHEGKIYMADTEKGIFILGNNQPEPLPGSHVFKNKRIADMVFDKPALLVVTEKNGLYIQRGSEFDTFHNSEFVSNALLTSALFTRDSQIVVGTVLKGLLFFNHEGRLLYSLNKKQGLQNNNVISMTSDFNGNIWTGTSNGIDQILINSPYTIMYPDLELEGSVYGVRIYNNKLYAGTNNGLYYTDWSTDQRKIRTQPFKKVNNSDGQVWALDEIDGDLFMCHNEGLFHIQQGEAIKISKDLVGVWRCISPDSSSSFIAGTYKGFQLYKKARGKWTFQKYLEGFKESARIIAMDDKRRIWVSHPYRGVYQLVVNMAQQKIQSLKIFGQKEGLAGPLSNYVTSLNGNIYVNGKDGLYHFNKESGKFEKDRQLSSFLDDKNITRRLFQSHPEYIWFVKEGETGLLHVRDLPTSKSTTSYLTSFLNEKLTGGFEYIYSVNADETFVCTDKGLVLMDVKKFLHYQPVIVRLNKISVLNGENDMQVSEGVKVSNSSSLTLEHNHNTLFFSIGSNQLDPTIPLRYSSILEGAEKEWTSWTYDTERVFHSLKPGKYSFRIKAKSSDGSISPEIKFSFVIKKPLYLSNTFIFIYVIMLISALWSLIKYLDKKHQNEKQQLISDIEATEAKVESLQEEKLQAEIDFKNKELALSTMHIVQKNEVLSRIRQELDYTLHHTTEPGTKASLRNIIHLLSDDQRLEEDWESFALHFDQVHTDFLRRIREKFPQLSNKDLKLCAYLRMNLTTKEIAPLLNISFRGVEISRYRLRKKMNLPTEMNLNDFMIQF
jgi:ligand-binding sensor domain-containing protein